MFVTLGVQRVKRSWNVINSKVFYIFFCSVDYPQVKIRKKKFPSATVTLPSSTWFLGEFVRAKVRVLGNFCMVISFQVAFPL